MSQDPWGRSKNGGESKSDNKGTEQESKDARQDRRSRKRGGSSLFGIVAGGIVLVGIIVTS